MADPLTAETQARMKADHVDSLMARHCDQDCVCMNVTVESCFPCDAALLLAELERVQAAKWWEAFPSYVRAVPLPREYQQELDRVQAEPCMHTQYVESSVGLGGPFHQPTYDSIATDHCHCGAEGLEMAHPRHDG